MLASYSVFNYPIPTEFAMFQQRWFQKDYLYATHTSVGINSNTPGFVAQPVRYL